MRFSLKLVTGLDPKSAPLNEHYRELINIKQVHSVVAHVKSQDHG